MGKLERKKRETYRWLLFQNFEATWKKRLLKRWYSVTACAGSYMGNY